MHTLDWRQRGALQSLPEELRLAFVGEKQFGEITRLTEEVWCYRTGWGKGPWFIGSFEEITEMIRGIPVAKPYTPRGAPDKNSFADLTIDLKLELF